MYARHGVLSSVPVRKQQRERIFNRFTFVTSNYRKLKELQINVVFGAISYLPL